MFRGKSQLYTTTCLTALGFMLIGYDNVSTPVPDYAAELKDIGCDGRHHQQSSVQGNLR